MNRVVISVSCAALMFVISCCNSIPDQRHAAVVERNVIDCFEKGLMNAEGMLVYCETSAVFYTGNKIVLGSDKPVPGDLRSAVFSTDYSSARPPELQNYLTEHAFKNVCKYEDFTITPDKKYAIATTGFDRIDKSSNRLDAYNTLLIWPVNNPDEVKIVSPTTNSGITSSVSLRTGLSYALKSHRFSGGMPYFKVEGLAAIPGNTLLFGIREEGKHYDDFEYAVKIIAVSYKIENSELLLADDFRLIYDYNPSTKEGLGHMVGLSGLEYDMYNERLYLLTSFEESETDEGLGGFLWTLTIPDLMANNAPELVMKNSLKPLVFAHKPEGIAPITKNTVFVIHDDDRVLGRRVVTDPETQFSREAHQGAYTIVNFLH